MPAASPTRSAIWNRRVVALLASGIAYFAIAGASFTVLPRLIERELGGGDAEVGLAFGALAVGMLAARPLAGYLGDRFGRRPLLIGGAVAVGLTQLAHVPAAELGGLPLLIVVRLAFGMAGSVMYVGMATMATELGPANKRGSVFATFSVAVFVGFFIGPIVGEVVLDAYGFTAAFATAAGFGFACAALALILPETRPSGLVARLHGLGSLFHPMAVRVGLVNLLVMTSFMAFNAFITPYAEELGAEDTAWIIATFSGTVLVLRASCGWLLDRGDRVALGTFATACVALAGAVLAFVPELPALYVAAVVLAGGLAFNVPLMVLIGADSAPEAERARVVATVVMFGDLANSLGTFALGLVADVSGYQAMYGVVAIAGLLALVLLRSPFLASVPGLRRPTPATVP